MRPAGVAGTILLAAVLLVPAGLPSPGRPSGPPGAADAAGVGASASGTPVENFTASVNRIVTLLGVAGSGLLAIAWARVALSWFSHDLTKKIQARDRARDALVGTLLFVAALSGLVWGLAHWVLTGT
ncbi:MAG TPA: hypothetical protein VMH78_02830 [Thermoplasmata archaeon]|nr:hypothetical protein [Thermoplasmata archaeon]